jgi:hypothetical protein
MRRSLALFVAAATMLSASAVSFAPSQAAPVSPTPVATALANDGIEQVRERRGRGDDRWRHGNRWRDDGRRHHRHGRRHHQGFPGFFFGFPYAFPPQAHYRRHYYGGDCFRTWDGQLICR